MPSRQLTQTTDGHGTANPIPAARANVIPSRSTCSRPRHFVTRQLSISGNQNPTSVRTRAICPRSRQVHEIRGAAFNAAIVVSTPCHMQIPCQDRRDRNRVLESVRHPYGIGLAKPVFRYPSEPTCHAIGHFIFTAYHPDSRTSTLHFRYQFIT